MRAEDQKMKRAGKVPLELILSDGATFPHKGEFAFADRQVDVRTGTIRVATAFPNPKRSSGPGCSAGFAQRWRSRRPPVSSPNGP